MPPLTAPLNHDSKGGLLPHARGAMNFTMSSVGVAS
jgi:hypothetical protein